MALVDVFAQLLLLHFQKQNANFSNAQAAVKNPAFVANTQDRIIAQQQHLQNWQRTPGFSPPPEHC